MSHSPVLSARPPACLALGVCLKKGPSRPEEVREPPTCILGAGSAVTAVADARGNSVGPDSPGPGWAGRVSGEPHAHARDLQLSSEAGELSARVAMFSSVDLGPSTAGRARARQGLALPPETSGIGWNTGDHCSSDSVATGPREGVSVEDPVPPGLSPSTAGSAHHRDSDGLPGG